jgi:hypothetical protein
MTFKILNVYANRDIMYIYNTLKICSDTAYGRFIALGNLIHSYSSCRSLKYCTSSKVPTEKWNSVLDNAFKDQDLRSALFLVKNPDVGVIRFGRPEDLKTSNVISYAEWTSMLSTVYNDTVKQHGEDIIGYSTRHRFNNLLVYQEIFNSLPEYLKKQHDNYRRTMESIG